MNQSIIDEQIKFWTEEFPSLERYYSDKNVSGVINLLRTIEDKIPSEALMDFIDGIALYPVYLKSQDPETIKKISEQIAPAFKLLIEHVGSDSYQNFLIDKTIPDGIELLINPSVKFPISKEAVRQHIKRTGKSPLLPKDIAPIQLDLITYLQNQFSQVNLVSEQPVAEDLDSLKKNNRRKIRKRLYRELLEKDYIRDSSEENFIKVTEGKVLPEGERITWNKDKKEEAHVFSEWLDVTKNHKKIWNRCFIFEDGKILRTAHNPGEKKETKTISRILRKYDKTFC